MGFDTEDGEVGKINGFPLAATGGFAYNPNIGSVYFLGWFG
jgi:hypothetical protein